MKGNRWWMAVGIVWTMALLFALLVIVPKAEPSEAPQCRIVGYVYGTPDLEQVDMLIDIPHGCQLTASRFERRLRLTSRRWTVEVALPDNGGWLPFAYTWGADHAYIGPHEITVLAGPREGLG